MRTRARGVIQNPATRLNAIAVVGAFVEPASVPELSGVRLRETDDLARVLVDSGEDFVPAPLRGGPIDIPVDELHMASCCSEPKSERITSPSPVGRRP